jgi:hypothetical protein
MREGMTAASQVLSLLRDGRSPPRPRFPRAYWAPATHRGDRRRDRGMRLEALVVLAALALLVVLCGSLILVAEHVFDDKRIGALSPGGPGPCGPGGAEVPQTTEGSAKTSSRGSALAC